MIALRKIADIDVLMAWRAEVLGCVFASAPSSSLMAENRDYYMRHVPDGSHVAYLALIDDIEVGCGAVCMYDEIPSPDNQSGRCAYIMNIYVREPWRHRGVATAIVSRLVEDAHQRSCGKIYLETTEMGRSLYRKLGFADMKGFMKHDQ